MALCSRSFEDLFKTSPLFNKLDKLSDAVVISGDGVVFKAHKLFLSKGSGYFNAFFKGNFGDMSDNVNMMFDSNTLEDILIFLYTGEIYLADENIVEIIKAADFLLIDPLLKKYREFALQNISLDCCITFLNLSHVVEILHIREHCFRFVQVNFGSLVHKDNSDIGKLPLDVFKDLISSDSLGVPDEETVWKAIVIWIEMDPIRLKNVLELIHCIRWSDVSYWLVSCIAVHPIFLDNELCRGIQLENLVRTENEINGAENNTSRFPKKLHIFTRKGSILDPPSTIEIYLTYDDDLVDIWRKIAEKEAEVGYKIPLLAVGQFVFMFSRSSNTMKSFNLVTKRWHQTPSLGSTGLICSILFCQNRIFAVGYNNDAVQYYDPDADVWSYCASLPSMNICINAATVLTDSLYVIGHRSHSEIEEMNAFKYDAAQDAWSEIVKTNHSYGMYASLISFREHLYLFGAADEEDIGTRSVEVYYPERNEWGAFPDLPFLYIIPRAVILKEKLIIYDELYLDFDLENPPCTWNEETASWNVEDASLLYNKIHLYEFCHVDDKRTLQELAKENRDPKTVWAKTPFE